MAACNQVDNGANSITQALYDFYVTRYVGCRRLASFPLMRTLTRSSDVSIMTMTHRGRGWCWGSGGWCWWRGCCGWCRRCSRRPGPLPGGSSAQCPRHSRPQSRAPRLQWDDDKNMIGDRFLLIDTRRMSYRVASCRPCHDQGARPASNEVRVISTPAGQEDTRNHYHSFDGGSSALKWLLPKIY